MRLHEYGATLTATFAFLLALGRLEEHPWSPLALCTIAALILFGVGVHLETGRRFREMSNAASTRANK